MGCQEGRVASLEEAVDRTAQVEEVQDVTLLEEEPEEQMTPATLLMRRDNGAQARGSIT